MNEGQHKGKADQSGIPLRRVIGPATAIFLVAGNMIGSGVFKKISPMSAALMDSHGILVAWALAGIVCIFGAFTIAGLSSLSTESGGIYEYLRIIFGDFFSFLYGWTCFLMIGSGGIAAIAFIFSQSVNAVIPLHDPLSAWRHFSLWHSIFPFEDSGVKILAVAAIGILTGVNILGTRKGGYVNNVITLLKIGGILALVIAGLWYGQNAAVVKNPVSPVIRSGDSVFSAVIIAMLSAFWAYDGWYCVSFVSGEIKNPKKNVALSIISGVGICVILYLLLNWTFMRVMPLASLAAIGENSVAALEVARVLSGNGSVVTLAVLIILSTFGSLNANIIAFPRLYYRMAQEKYFPRNAAHVHPRYRTPYVALIYSMVWSCILVISGSFDLLTDIVIFAEFLFFALLGWGLIKMKRAGKISTNLIAYPVAPLVLILFSFILLVNTLLTQPLESIAGLLSAISGIPVYYYYRKRKDNPEDRIQGPGGQRVEAAAFPVKDT